MIGTPGIQTFTGNGTISPFGVTRVYSVDFASAGSTSNISLYNSNTGTNIIVRLNTDNQGIGHYEWKEGLLFKTGVFFMTNTNHVVTASIMYHSEK